MGAAPVSLDAVQTLQYTIPAGSEHRKFDEIQIVYYRGRPQMSRSVNLSLERFVLVTRGQ